MTDQTITYNEFDEKLPPLGRGPGTDNPIDFDAWPPKSEGDGLEYGLGWSTNMRARMAENDTHPDAPALIDGSFEWVPIDPERVEPNDATKNLVAEKRGSYSEMARYAVALNKRTDMMAERRPFTFHPVPLAEIGAR